MWRFVPLAYGLDLRVLDQVVKLPQPRLLRDSGGRDDDGEVQGRPARYLPVPSGTPHLRLRAPHSFPDQGRLAVGRIPVGTTIFFAAWLVGWTVEDSRSRQLNPRSSAFPLRFSVGCSASDDSDHDGRHDERTPPHEFAGHLATHDGMRETVTND